MLIPTKPADYKDITVKQPEFDRLWIPAEIIRSAKIFQAVGDVRWFLNGIHFNHNGFIEATNGHIAIRIECEECKRLSKSLILNIKGARIPVKAKNLEIVSLDAKKGVVLAKDGFGRDIGEVRFFEVVDGEFTDLDKVIKDSPYVGIEKICVSPTLMEKISEAAKILGSKSSPVIEMSFRGQEELIEIRFNSLEYKATVILMPMRW